MRPLRIVFVISSLKRGGAEKILAWLATCCGERRHDVSIVTWENDASVPAYKLDLAISRISLNLQKDSRHAASAIRNNLFRIQKMRRVVRAINPDLVVSFGDTTNIVTLFACFHTGIPVIVSERIDPRAWPNEHSWRCLRLLSYMFAKRIVVQTIDAQSYFSWISHKIECIPNPVMIPDQNYLASPESPLILAVGRLTAQKRFDLLIRAFASVKDKHPKWELMILGDGDQRWALEQLRDSLNLHRRIHFAGKIDDIRPSMKAASIFALSSDFEGFPNALCEAMSHGLAPIATATAGAKAIIRNGIDGMLVPVGDVSGLSKALDQLVGDVELRRRLARRAVEVTDRFSEEKVFSLWESIFLKFPTRASEEALR